MVTIFVFLLLARPNPAGDLAMVWVPAGDFVPLYRSNSERIAVPAFKIDSYPVTNAEYLAFVKANPRWQRSQIIPLFADQHYLTHWTADLQIDAEGSLDQSPVVNISWFAAKAYCQWRGKRLPTVNEWERVAQIGFTQMDGNLEPGFYDQLLNWYGRPNPAELPNIGLGPPNLLGIYDLHGLIWEWTLDFQSALVSGESRGDSAIERQLYCGGGAVGASDFKNYAAFMRFAFRSSLQANFAVGNLGCRCAEGVDNEP